MINATWNPDGERLVRRGDTPCSSLPDECNQNIKMVSEGIM